jgi:hypothetical protein
MYNKAAKAILADIVAQSETLGWRAYFRSHVKPDHTGKMHSEYGPLSDTKERAVIGLLAIELAAMRYLLNTEIDRKLVEDNIFPASEAEA